MIVADTSVLFEAWERGRDGDPVVRRRVGELMAEGLVGTTAIRWRARRSLAIPGQANGLIIGTCLEYGVQVLTLDRRHYEGTPGLDLAPLELTH